MLLFFFKCATAKSNLRQPSLFSPDLKKKKKKVTLNCIYNCFVTHPSLFAPHSSKGQERKSQSLKWVTFLDAI